MGQFFNVIFMCPYCRKYVPKVAKFPPQYIYEPWKAPLSTQKAAGCIIGKDYPARIVDHETIVKTNLQRMNQAYSKSKSDGNPPTSSKRSLSEMEKSDDYSDETLTEGSGTLVSKDSRPASKKRSSSSTKQLSVKELFQKSKK